LKIILLPNCFYCGIKTPTERLKILDFMGKNIYLTGFMGTGKTTVGKILASRLGWGFVDLDDLIEQDSSMKITEIFKEYGEQEFRRMEKQALKQSLSKDKFVIACGGGIVLDPENVDLINNQGIGICLWADAEAIYERVRQFTHRPLLNVDNPRQKIRELLDRRRPYYEKISCQVNTNAKSPQQVAEEIIALLKNRGILDG